MGLFVPASVGVFLPVLRQDDSFERSFDSRKPMFLLRFNRFDKNSCKRIWSILYPQRSGLPQQGFRSAERLKATPRVSLREGRAYKLSQRKVILGRLREFQYAILPRWKVDIDESRFLRVFSTIEEFQARVLVFRILLEYNRRRVVLRLRLCFATCRFRAQERFGRRIWGRISFSF